MIDGENHSVKSITS